MYLFNGQTRENVVHISPPGKYFYSNQLKLKFSYDCVLDLSLLNRIIP